MGVGEGQERKEGRFSPFALSLLAYFFLPPPPPLERPDTQARVYSRDPDLVYITLSPFYVMIGATREGLLIQPFVAESQYLRLSLFKTLSIGPVREIEPVSATLVRSVLRSHLDT